LGWRDFRLNLTSGPLAPSSAYVRLPNGTSFGWSENRTLADNETIRVELHYRANGSTEEPTTGVYDGPAWRVSFALPSASQPSPPFGGT